jgi:hypothetical protein
MSRRLLRDGNEGESSVNGVHIFSGNTSQIVEGGCYQPSATPDFKSPPKLQPASRRWIAVAFLGHRRICNVEVFIEKVAEPTPHGRRPVLTPAEIAPEQQHFFLRAASQR